MSQSGCPRFLQADDPRALYEVGQQTTAAAVPAAGDEMELNPAFLPLLETVVERVMRANEERAKREGHGRGA